MTRTETRTRARPRSCVCSNQHGVLVIALITDLPSPRTELAESAVASHRSALVGPRQAQATAQRRDTLTATAGYSTRCGGRTCKCDLRTRCLLPYQRMQLDGNTDRRRSTLPLYGCTTESHATAPKRQAPWYARAAGIGLARSRMLHLSTLEHPHSQCPPLSRGSAASLRGRRGKAGPMRARCKAGS